MKIKVYLLRIILVFFLIIPGIFLWADIREEPVDIIIALDKSNSMVEEIEAVKEYVNTRIVDQFLQKDDFFMVIAFFGKTLIPISTHIKGDEHKKEIKRIIYGIKANGDYTDIGNALDGIKNEIKRQTHGKRKRTLLLITDGKHNPVPASKYFSEDGSYSHEYLKVTSETQKQGWKVIVLGIGKESAKDLAEELAAEYKEASENVTPEELDKIIPYLAGTINVKEKYALLPVNQSGKSIFKIPIEINSYQEPPEIIINEIMLKSDSLFQANLLSKPFKTLLPCDGRVTLNIPVTFSLMLKPGMYEGNLTLKFSSKESFDNQYNVKFRVNTFLQDFPYLIPAIILLALIILVIFIFLIRNFITGKNIIFKLIVEEHPLKKGKDTFTANKAKELYLNESMDIFGITDKKTARSIAMLTVTDAGLRMTCLKEDRFPLLKDTSKNVLGNNFIIRTEMGKDCHIRFVALKNG